MMMSGRKVRTRGGGRRSSAKSEEVKGLAEMGHVVDMCIANYETNDKGISFLEAKNHLMIDYLNNLLVLIMTKLQGKELLDSAVVDRLIFLQVALDKIKPIDKRLRFQVDKVVKLALGSSGQNSDGGGGGDDDDNDLSLRPNPGRMRPKEGAAVSTQQQHHAGVSADSSKSTGGVYQPPKMAAMPYHEDDRSAAKEKRRQERERSHMLQSSLMKELASAYSDRPEEVAELDASSVANLKAGRQAKKNREIEAYEEANFVRLARTKEAKRKSNPRSALHDIADFSGYKGYNTAAEELLQTVKRSSMREKMSQAKRPKVAKKVLKKSPRK